MRNPKHQTRHPAAMKTETLFGIHPVSEGLRAARRTFSEIYLAKTSARLEKVIALAESRGVPVRKVSPSQLEAMSGTGMHQGIGAKVSRYPLADFSEITASPKGTGSPPFLLLLDNVVDSRNLGAMIRTALCTGIDGVIIPKDRSAPPTPGVSAASAGALEHIRLVQVTNLVSTIKELRQQGIWIAGTARDAPQSLFDSDLSDPLAIVIGGEEKGMRPLVRKQCDFLMSVPQEGPVTSLNASVAGAVVMYETLRQRRYIQ